MIFRTFSAAFLCAAALVAGAGSALAAPLRADQILERFRNANDWRDHVMVVAHRGAAFEGGVEVVAENSLASLNRAVELGVDMVEIDVRRTLDGVFVVSHDDTLDRATNCTGAVADTSFAAISGCKLLSGPDRVETAETVPTLAQFLTAAKGQVMINLDNKVGADSIRDIYDVAESVGMTDYVVTTIAANSPAQLDTALEVQAELGTGVQLMPNVRDDLISGHDHLAAIYDTLGFDVIQGRDTYRGGALTSDGGVLFNQDALDLATAHNVHLWVNTLSFPEEPDMRAGGRGDHRAFILGDLDGSFGFWAGLGVTMMQTDEPDLLIGYLDAMGRRVAYAAAPIPAPVPLPAAGWALLAAMGGLAALRRRSTAA
ncbi:MAG: glycerophosphodiester phosphodiesterase family protein [Paracoccus sp. (in: a-proteobacteria)]|uniref:glycerophosphodiester phosphodiesterase family protein n=1 Tax=Paracoccus sp. TaxID=267 RepID=UPI0026DEA492|nr:glycerophosphodiester phosphodiesterase family protein [Paracoccus sp. (in: a-proteobacteria)]MDO5612007.1 glycerophosphodiester phosphodiesterase family protein [Paracoccus sp. (in: a-proteobacteria)]